MRSTSRIFKIDQMERQAVTIGIPNPVEHKAPPLVPTKTKEQTLIESNRKIEAMLEEAREAARLTIAAAEAKAQAITEAAQQAGYEEGLKKGVATVEKQMTKQVQTLKKIASQAKTEKQRLILESEADLIPLILDVARKVIHEEISINQEIVLSITEAALDKIISQEITRIRVCPTDVELVKRFWNTRNGVEEDAPTTQIVPDKRIQPGGCIIDTRGGSVDAQIETQLTEIRRAFETMQELNGDD